MVNDQAHNPPTIRRSKRRNRMFCVPQTADAYQIGRHSYSAIGNSIIQSSDHDQRPRLARGQRTGNRRPGAPKIAAGTQITGPVREAGRGVADRPAYRRGRAVTVAARCARSRAAGQRDTLR